MTLRNLIPAARFTGFLFHGDVGTQHSRAGLFSNVHFADFISGLPKVVVALGLLGLCFITVPTQTPTSGQDVDVIRTETDRGFILLIDRRFAETRYRQLLPAHWAHGAWAYDERAVCEVIAKFWNGGR